MGTRPPSHAANLSRACAVALGLVVSGCSFSYQLDNLFAKKDEPQYTGSLRLAQNRPTAQMPPEADLLVARAAVNEMLARGGKDTSMPWENPDTGARGTITPLASAYTQEGSTCRDFQAGDRILAAGRSVPSCAGEMGSVPSAPLEEHVTNLPTADLVA